MLFCFHYSDFNKLSRLAKKETILFPSKIVFRSSLETLFLVEGTTLQKMH